MHSAGERDGGGGAGRLPVGGMEAAGGACCPRAGELGRAVVGSRSSVAATGRLVGVFGCSLGTESREEVVRD